MGYFKYQARDSKHASISGMVEAANEKEAILLLRKKNFFVVKLDEQKKSNFSIPFLSKSKKVGFSEVVTFTRQLSTMIVAGLMLPDALSILEKQSTKMTTKVLIKDIERKIISGSSFTNALIGHQGIFSPIYLALIRAGEASGSLDTVLERLADTLESQKEFKAKIVGALIYPIIILIGMIGVVIIMMTVVIPRLSGLYKEFGIDLPWTTQLLINMSELLITYWWAFIILIIGASAGFVRWKRTAIGRYAIDTIILKIPIVGDLVIKVMLVEFTRTFSMLTSSGIHVLDSLKMLRSSLGNVRFETALTDVSLKVEKGYSLGDAFGLHDIFPPIVQQMIRVGEETGKLDDTLMKLSTYFQSESEHAVKGLMTAIEPAIMVVLGAGVGFIVISVITPIYNLTSNFR